MPRLYPYNFSELYEGDEGAMPMEVNEYMACMAHKYGGTEEIDFSDPRHFVGRVKCNTCGEAFDSKYQCECPNPR